MFKARVELDPLMGRSLVTTEPIQKAELVVEETPFAYGPKQNSGIVCLGCYRYLQFGEDGDSIDRCDICDWPLCSACVNLEDHQAECQIFSNAKVTFAGNVSDDGICTQLDCVTPLRVLLAKEADPERWAREVASMEYHNESRRQMLDIWHADLINIAQYLRGPCKLADRFSEDLIMQVVGILEVNAFEARNLQGYPLRCLYPLTGILAHNCVPNTTRSIYPSEKYKIRLRAMCDLVAGQQLQHSYTYTLNGTAQRQEHLRSGKFFTCDCKRCKDPTELGINFSTFKCNKCDDGWILCTNPINPITDWKCNTCGFKTLNDTIQQAITLMQAEIADIQSIESGAKRLEATEKLMHKYKSFVHPFHFIQTGLRQNLIEMYGRVQGYEMVELSDAQLAHKLELCRQVLKVLDVYEPNISRSRAMMLYEMHVPLVLLAKSAFISGNCNAEALKKQLLDAVKLLDECVNILQYEDAGTQEGALGQTAAQAQKHLNTSIEGLSVDNDVA